MIYIWLYIYVIIWFYTDYIVELFLLLLLLLILYFHTGILSFYCSYSILHAFPVLPLFSQSSSPISDFSDMEYWIIPFALPSSRYLQMTSN